MPPTDTPTLEPPTPTLTPQPPLVLIYAVLDNDLGDEAGTWERLVNNAEAGVHSGINVRLYVDGPRNNDARIYDLQQDTQRFCPNLANLDCNGHYQSGQTITNGSENGAHPDTLVDFLKTSLSKHPNASRIVLSLVGHGSGWSANALPGQPSRWGGQATIPTVIEERVGGLLWDDDPGDGGTSRSLSTRALAYALDRFRQETGRTIDLLYLDACSMGMSEVAYELRGSISYLLASPNTAWASFAYDDMLRATNGTLGAQELGMVWIQVEADALGNDARNHPYTLTLINTAKLDPLRDQVTALGDALQSILAGQRGQVQQAAANAERYESNYDGLLDANDTYVDLSSFAQALESRFAGNSTIVNAAQAVRTAVNDAVDGAEHFNGYPWPYPGVEWRWQSAGGLALYFPAAQADNAKRALYTADNLQWAQDSTWDEFLHAYWGTVGHVIAAQSELPTCVSTRECSQLPQQLAVHTNSIHLPVIMR